MFYFLFVAFLLSVECTLFKPPLPPRGWNSYDSFDVCNESVAIDAAHALATTMLSSGYSFLTLDAGWFGAQTVNIDNYGRPVPDPNLFPSAKGGSFLPFVQSVNKIGLSVGLWYMGGMPTASAHQNTPIKGTSYHAQDIVLADNVYCPRWDRTWGYEVDHRHPAAQAWFDSLVELWSSWGIELIKLDCVNAEDEAFSHRMDVLSFYKSFQKSQQKFVFSLSPGGFSNISQLLDIAQYTSMARVTDDFWDNWELYMNQGGGGGTSSGASHWDAARDLVAAVKSVDSTFWIDFDMIPFGRIGHVGSSCSAAGPGCPRQDRFTIDEKRSIISLWALAQSPIIWGGDPTLLTTEIKDLLTNQNILSMISDIKSPHESLRVNTTTKAFIVWQGFSKSSQDVYLSVFNLRNNDQTISIGWDELGIGSCSTLKMMDLWTSAVIPCDTVQYSVTLLPHAVQLLKLQPQ